MVPARPPEPVMTNARTAHRLAGTDGRSEVGPVALALPGRPLDGQHAGRVEHLPPAIMRCLNQPIWAEPHAEQRMLQVIEGPARAQPLQHQPDLPALADYRLQQADDHLAVHSATLRPGPRFAEYLADERRPPRLHLGAPGSLQAARLQPDP